MVRLDLKRLAVRPVLLPAGHRIVAEGHFVCVVAGIPLGVAVGEEDVLALAMRLPFFPRNPVGRAADAVLRVVILVCIRRLEVQRDSLGRMAGAQPGPERPLRRRPCQVV